MRKRAKLSRRQGQPPLRDSVCILRSKVRWAGPTATSTRFRLHLAIQSAMGWTNSHLYEIRDGDVGWGITDPDWG
jgi:hypothetical protein